MRSKNAAKNIAFSLWIELFSLAAGLIVPRYIILTYGSSINGLTSTINRLLSLINLMQAGAVGSSIYQMYKPVAEEDYETQSAILYSSRQFYKRIGIYYFSFAMAFAVVYSFILKDENFKQIEIFFSFFILSINGLMYIFFNSRYDIFLSSHQKRYLMNLSDFIERLVYYALLAAVLLQKLHFLFMYLAMAIGGVVRVCINTYFYRRESQGKIINNPKNKTYVIPGRKYLMLSSIGEQAITAAPPVIISTIVNLAYSSVYSVYAMVFTAIRSLLNALQLSISAIFGNLVASSDDENISRVFNLVQFLFVMTGCLFASVAAYMFIPFIRVYTTGITDVNYMWSNLAFFSVLFISLFALNLSFGYVCTVYGLFKEICVYTLTYGCIGIVCSIILVYIGGMPYVMIGTLLYYVLQTITQNIILNKRLSWFTNKKLLQRCIMLFVLPTLMFFSYQKFQLFNIDSWLKWFLVALGISLICILIILTYCAMFERTELSQLVVYFKNFLRKRKVDD